MNATRMTTTMGLILWLLAPALPGQRPLAATMGAVEALQLPPLTELAGLQGGWRAARVGIDVRAHSIVSDGALRLGDLADLEGGDEEARKRLAEAALGDAPAAGQTIRLTATTLEAMLARAGFGKQDFELRMPKLAGVERAAQVITAEMIQQRVVESALASIAAPREDILFSAWTLPAETRVPVGAAEIEISFVHGSRLVGKRTFEAVCRVEGAVAARVRGGVSIDIMVQALRAAAPISRGALITPDLVGATREALSFLPAGAATDPMAIIGKVSERALTTGDVIREDQVVSPQLVASNDAVIMELSGSGMRLQTMGQARARGALHDIIPVVNVSSGKRLMGRVIGPRRVEVLY